LREILRQSRERRELVLRLKGEALELAEQQKIRVDDAIEFLTGDFDLRKEVRLAVTWILAEEAAAAERNRVATEAMAAERRRLRPLIDEATEAWCCYRGGDPQVHDALGVRLTQLRADFRSTITGARY
jgi:hypothetical protein